MALDSNSDTWCVDLLTEDDQTNPKTEMTDEDYALSNELYKTEMVRLAYASLRHPENNHPKELEQQIRSRYFELDRDHHHRRREIRRPLIRNNNDEKMIHYQQNQWYKNHQPTDPVEREKFRIIRDKQAVEAKQQSHIRRLGIRNEKIAVVEAQRRDMTTVQFRNYTALCAALQDCVPRSSVSSIARALVLDPRWMADAARRV